MAFFGNGLVGLGGQVSGGPTGGFGAFDPRAYNQQKEAENANLQQMAQSRGGGWQGALQAGVDQQRTQMGPQTQAAFRQRGPSNGSQFGGAQQFGGRVTMPRGMLASVGGQMGREAGSVRSTINKMNAPDMGGVRGGYMGPNPVELERQRMAMRQSMSGDFAKKGQYALAGYMSERGGQQPNQSKAASQSVVDGPIPQGFGDPNRSYRTGNELSGQASQETIEQRNKMHSSILSGFGMKGQ